MSPAGAGHQPIPVVEFSVVDSTVLIPPRCDNPQAIAFGFNDGTPWKLGTDAPATDPATGGEDDPNRYIRYLQPMEADLARQVEYDMDEQDQIWLDNYNLERKATGIPPVSYDIFEILFDKLEKEWFDLNKTIPKKDKAMPVDEGKCAICDDGECENSNAIVFCDGCNLAVHQDCYGVPYIPEGQWLCRKCTVSPDKPVSCVLCPNSYGAFKQTTTAQWAHLLCAIWIPDTGVSNTVYMEPIDGVEHINKNRWRLICYLCRKRVGACIQCANRNCFAAFHVTCARDFGLELKMKQGNERGELRAYCEKHGEKPRSSVGGIAGLSATPQQQRLLAMQHEAGDSRKSPGVYLPPGVSTPTPPVLKTTASADGQGASSSSLRVTLSLAKSSKSKLAYKKTYSGGPPLVPAFIVDRVLTYVQKLTLARKKEFLNTLCRYWSLKREARRGAPLLKRLHLEPWTASGSTRQQTELEKARKLELMRLARNDLEQVRMLTEQVRKRERKKLERCALVRDVVDRLLYPLERTMRDVLKILAGIDKNMFFAQPVSRALVPDYYDIVRHPMDWQTMSEKLDRHEYPTAAAFKADIELVISNARLYNTKDSPIYRAAIKIRDAIVDPPPPRVQAPVASPAVSRKTGRQPRASTTTATTRPSTATAGPSVTRGAAAPLLAQLAAMDSVDAESQVTKARLDEVLTRDLIDELFEYDTTPIAAPIPTPAPAPALAQALTQGVVSVALASVGSQAEPSMAVDRGVTTAAPAISGSVDASVKNTALDRDEDAVVIEETPEPDQVEASVSGPVPVPAAVSTDETVDATTTAAATATVSPGLGNGRGRERGRGGRSQSRGRGQATGTGRGAFGRGLKREREEEEQEQDQEGGTRAIPLAAADEGNSEDQAMVVDGEAGVTNELGASTTVDEQAATTETNVGTGAEEEQEESLLKEPGGSAAPAIEASVADVVYKASCASPSKKQKRTDGQLQPASAPAAVSTVTPASVVEAGPSSTATPRAAVGTPGRRASTRLASSTPAPVSKSARKSEAGTAKKASKKRAADVVQDIDPKTSFKLFEAGWVLPEGSSRRRN